MAQLGPLGWVGPADEMVAVASASQEFIASAGHRATWFVVSTIAPRVLAVVRTARPMAEGDIEAAYGALMRRLGPSPLDGLLVDLRDAPGRNDEAYETGIRPFRTALLRRAQRVAVLVGTSAGMLQVQRHAREDGLAVIVTRDEAEARRVALGTTLAP